MAMQPLKKKEPKKFNVNDFKSKIGIQQNDTEEIITLLESRLEKDENGDLFYILACVYKRIGKKDEYIFNLKKAIKNSFTLSFPIDIVKKEFALLNSKEDLEVDEVEEYSADLDKNIDYGSEDEDKFEDIDIEDYDEVEDNE